MNAVDAYKSIFDLSSKDFKLEGVVLTGGGETREEKETYRFTAVLSAPAPIESLSVDESEQVVLINHVRKVFKKLAGPDLVIPVEWKIKTKDGKGKKKFFYFAGSLTPLTVLGFEIVGGRYYVKAEMHGVFY